MRTNHFKKLSNSSLYFSAIILFFVLCTTPLFAGMKEVSEGDLSRVSAQAGITYNWGGSKLNITYNSWAISDTDSTPQNWLEFNNIDISGPDGYFTLDEAADPYNLELPMYHFNSVDIGTLTNVDGNDRAFIQLIDSTHTNQRNWTVGNLVFCGQDLGSLQFDTRNLDSTILEISTHGAGYSGIEFEYLSNWELNNFKYNYNKSGGSLSVSGIHIAEYADSFGDNPADPSTWTLSGRFRIGDIAGGIIDVDNDPSNTPHANPALFDVGTSASDGTVAMLNLPMKGTIRMESVDIGGTNFGPVAIDGITVHHLLIKVNPGY